MSQIAAGGAHVDASVREVSDLVDRLRERADEINSTLGGQARRLDEMNGRIYSERITLRRVNERTRGYVGGSRYTGGSRYSGGMA